MSSYSVYDGGGNYLGEFTEGGGDGGGPETNIFYNRAVFWRIAGVLFSSLLAGILTYIMITKLVLTARTVVDGLIVSIPILVTILILVICDIIMFKKLLFLVKCKIMANEYKKNKDIKDIKTKFRNFTIDSEIRGLIPSTITSDKLLDMDNIFDDLKEIYKDSRKDKLKLIQIISIIVSVALYLICTIAIIMKSAGLVSEDNSNRILAVLGVTFGFGFIYLIIVMIVKIVKKLLPKKVAFSILISTYLGILLGYILQLVILLIITAIAGEEPAELSLGMECIVIGILATFELSCKLLNRKTKNKASANKKKID